MNPAHPYEATRYFSIIAFFPNRPDGEKWKVMSSALTREEAVVAVQAQWARNRQALIHPRK